MRKSALRIAGVVVAVFAAILLVSVGTMSVSVAKQKSFSQLTVGKQRLSISSTQRTRLVRSMGTLNFTCNGLYCACKGDADCNDMFTTNVCGPSAICVGNYCYCDRR